MAVLDVTKGLIDDGTDNLTIAGDLSVAGTIINAYAFVLTQPAWFVDPANASGRASDKNDGSTTLTPLLTQAELSRRWAAAAGSFSDGFFPVMQDIVVTYMSAPPNPVADPIRLNVARHGSANLSFVYAPATVRTTTISGISTVRSGSNWWRISTASPFTSADLASNGALLRDTTTGACAFAAFVSTGSVADTTEWISYQANPISLNGLAGPAMAAPQVADSITVVSLARVKVTAIHVRQVAAAGTGFVRWGVSFANFRFASDPSGGLAQNDALTIQAQMSGIGLNANGVSFTQCVFEGAINQLTSYNALINCYCPQSQNTSWGRLLIIGGLTNGVTMNGSSVIIDGFNLVQGRFGDQSAPVPSIMLVGLACLYGVRDAFTGEQGTEIRVQAIFYVGTIPTALICGTCERYVFRIVNTSALFNMDGAAWATMIKASSGFFFGMEGSVGASMLAFDPATLLIGSTLYPITIANLDGVLSGSAINPCQGTTIRVFSSH